MNFFNDCDTSYNWGGNDDNAAIYLYDASPFVLRINDAGDTVLNYYMYNADWLSDDGLRPLQGLLIDSVSYSDYRYVLNRKLITKDSSIGVEIEYFAPKHPDTCDFIVLKQKFYNNDPYEEIPGVYIGNFVDWDIPSDSGVENGSDFDRGSGPGSRDLMYCYGGEYGEDSIPNNDCVPADYRCGGLAFYNGVKLPYFSSSDSFENPPGPWWTHMLADWVFPSGGFVAGQLYRKMENLGSVWEPWESTNPTMEDSLYQDLYTAAVFGKFNMGVSDTFLFVSILATEYDQGYPGLYATVDMARAWIAARPEIWCWPYPVIGRCCFGSVVDPSCEEITMNKCEAKPDYISWDYGLNCTDDPCPPFGPIGRCCYGNPLFGYCEDITEIECTKKTPPYSWDSTMNCAEHPCEDRIGRCCYGDPADPQCADVTYWDCLVLGKISWDYGLNCAEHSCLNLVAYWKFDETGGLIAYDSSGYGNDGTLQNSPARISGLMGRALEFDGIDDYVYVPDNSSLRPSTLTLMAWIRPYRLPYTSTYGPIVKRTPEWENDANWQIQIVASGRVNFAFYNNGWRDSPLTNDSVKVDKWNHIAITFRDREVRIYINGILDAAFPYTMDADLPTGYSSPVIIGKGWADKFEGRIDEVKIYAQALSDSLILKKYIEAGCGDVNDDNAVNMLDILYLISYLYKGGPAPVPLESGDANGDGKTDMLDILHLISYLYKNGKPPICS
jgi:hypothetical protein